MATTLTPHRRPATRESLREIARLPDGDCLSVIFNLDPREFGTAPARATALRSLEDEVRRAANGTLNAEADAILTYLNEDGFDPSAGLAAALFASRDGGYFEIVMLPSAVPSSAAAAPYPAVAPLATFMDDETWCVALVDRTTAHILYGTPRTLREWREIEDDVHGQHKAGGWSQARWERSVEVEVEWHLERVAELVARVRTAGYDRLAIGATPEMEPRVLEALESEDRRRYEGRFGVDVQNTTEDEVRDAAGELFALRDWERIATTLGRVASRASDGQSASGVQNVSSALEQMRVETLVLDPSIDRASFFVRQAAMQDAVVLTAPGPALRDHQGAAAVLRF